MNPDQLAIEKKLQSPIFTRSVSVAVTDLGSLHLLFHRGYSLQDGPQMRQQLPHSFFCLMHWHSSFRANQRPLPFFEKNP